MEKMQPDERLREPSRCQEHWYSLVSKYVEGKTVLDVGAGTGYGLQILDEHAASVHGIDPLPVGSCVLDRPVESFPDAAFDVATAMDVIEHVEDDASFLRHLLRVAREAVFLSTPNWDRFHASNPYHVREYTADELSGLIADSGFGYEAWHTDDWPSVHQPWRVPTFGTDATNYGMWIWKTKRLRHRDEPLLELWDEQKPTFLSDDRANPARAEAARMIGGEVSSGSRTMIEIGPGPGYDYRDHFCRIHGLSYAAYEASTGLLQAFKTAAPAADVRLGGFLDLAPESADIVYTKATLEHQRDFRDGLRRMVTAARNCVLINWYLPPAAVELRQKDGREIHYNRYLRGDVTKFLVEVGLQHAGIDLRLETRKQGPPGNELWLIRKRKKTT